MKLSSVTRLGDGATDSFDFSFSGGGSGYIRKEDIRVTVTSPEGQPEEVEFDLTSSNTLRLKETPEVDSTILIRRVMPKDRNYADFRKGNNFREQVINNSFLQLLYLVQELLDGYFTESTEFAESAVFLKDLTVNRDLKVLGQASVKSVSGDEHSILNKSFADVTYIPIAGTTEVTGRLLLQEPIAAQEPQTKGRADKQKEDLEDTIQSNYATLVGVINEILKAATGGLTLQNDPVIHHARVLDKVVVVPPNSEARSFGDELTIVEEGGLFLGEGSEYKFL